MTTSTLRGSLTLDPDLQAQLERAVGLASRGRDGTVMRDLQRRQRERNERRDFREKSAHAAANLAQQLLDAGICFYDYRDHTSSGTVSSGIGHATIGALGLWFPEEQLKRKHFTAQGLVEERRCRFAFHRYAIGNPSLCNYPHKNSWEAYGLVPEEIVWEMCGKPEKRRTEGFGIRLLSKDVFPYEGPAGERFKCAYGSFLLDTNGALRRFVRIIRQYGLDKVPFVLNETK